MPCRNGYTRRIRNILTACYASCFNYNAPEFQLRRVALVLRFWPRFKWAVNLCAALLLLLLLALSMGYCVGLAC